jgi:hypothetical protein
MRRAAAVDVILAGSRRFEHIRTQGEADPPVVFVSKYSSDRDAADTICRYRLCCYRITPPSSGNSAYLVTFGQPVPLIYEAVVSVTIK